LKVKFKIFKHVGYIVPILKSMGKVEEFNIKCRVLKVKCINIM
jgi:hypothetical protein